MAKKLETKVFHYQDKHKSKDLKLDIFIAADNTFYFQRKQIPKVLLDFFPHDLSVLHEQVYDDTYKGLCRLVTEFLQRYEDAKLDETKEKVIIYEMKLNGDLTPDLGGDDKKSLRFTDIDNKDHLGLLLEWQLGWRCKKGGKITYHRYQYSENDEGPDRTGIPTEEVGYEIHGVGGRHSSTMFMEWTPEREAWFERTEGSLRQLLIGIEAFFRRKPAELVESIEKNQTYLLGGGKDGKG